ncbi:peptide-N4-(N-acetyl-beta-glucosaminyl)asparagine amidase A [Ricinus communis]|uniref:Peptide-N4-(N-acetyl-beta-glucosaminyl)asparagine amidase A, putative n=1 Tax=Ricinus communis TaxID=3988 RepID=B9SEV0_RICCO|nr:peptide-N4-(N-acetyl-beta-glucosaminyl)asparagine amidase A [Ricinus communis]EEF37846.1 Peptide-N4-(N-acetyl-beta-glucosaminyl)asparagine amidase A, putative [Ricinus communis]|eukprot:XP_002524519.1 peptide-N4-(N-acetyl-beta-glucosaminyl)asparagine amidase A [Ricinus communis]
MATSCLSRLLLFSFLLLDPFPSAANIHKANNLLFTEPISILSSSHSTNPPTPTVYFEVTKPIHVPNTKPCIHTVLQHDFGYTYGKSPVLANYTPPSHCPSQHFSKIILEWNATCKGRQFDRIFGVWLGGVELLRSCTAEPRATGIFWSVQKDITRYYSSLLKDETQELAVYLGNLVDSTYTGVYRVNVTLYFYPAEDKSSYNENSLLDHFKARHDSKADLILPISRDLPLNDGLWFQIQNSTDTQLKEFEIPPNVYRAVLEVYVSFHENDEFWYSNYYNEYISANNLTGSPGNGPFREVIVSLDGEVLGAIWPFTVIYTGGINPLLWRPITAIGSFDLPSYDLEMTPLLGSVLDGKTHKLGFSVTNALNVWYIDANLHLWLDHKSKKIEGKVLKHEGKPLAFSLISNFKDLNGTFLAAAQRSISSTGWVKCSFGKITTHFNQRFSYNNSMEMGDDGNLQIVNQTINFTDSVSFRKLTSSVHSFKSFKNFNIGLYSDFFDQGNGTSLYVTNVTLGFNEKKSKDSSFGFDTSSLKNLQNAQGVMVVKNNLVVNGVGSTQQVYKYDGDKFCYFRNVSSSNYTILYDKVGNKCNKKEQSHLGFGLSRWWPLPTRRASLASELLNNHGV